MAERTGGGILVEPENPASLTEGLLKLIRDPELRADHARKGHAGVRKHYTVAQMAEQTLAAFSRQRAAVIS
jgi:glycosyltransferase involved in cell wall biosynthesis